MPGKTMYIDCLIDSKNAVLRVNEDLQEVGYMTYFTSNGIIVGKVSEVNSLEMTDDGNSEEELARRFKENIPVTVFDVADGMFKNLVKDSEDNIEKDSKSIILEDVQILTYPKHILKLNFLVLFTDQIIGIAPGRIDLNTI